MAQSEPPKAMGRGELSVFFRGFKIVRGALIFSVFYLAGAFSGVLVLPLLSLTTRDPLTRMRRNQLALSAWFRFTLDLLRWARIFSFDARSVVPGLPERPVIVIANHPTTIDVVAVLAVYREACVVVKHKIWRDPFLRHIFRWCGHVDGGDGSMEANTALLQNLQTRIAQGFSVVVFPEGTRSPPRGLGPMFKGAFAVASTTQTDLLPVVITAEPPALHKAAPWHVLPDKPVDYRVRPQSVLSARNSSARKLQRQVLELYRRELQLPADALDETPAAASS
jgi:1-acyl-sn-glycerol-3-phosphate acyltransferase